MDGRWLDDALDDLNNWYREYMLLIVFLCQYTSWVLRTWKEKKKNTIPWLEEFFKKFWNIGKMHFWYPTWCRFCRSDYVIFAITSYLVLRKSQGRADTAIDSENDSESISLANNQSIPSPSARCCKRGVSYKDYFNFVTFNRHIYVT